MSLASHAVVCICIFNGIINRVSSGFLRCFVNAGINTHKRSLKSVFLQHTGIRPSCSIIIHMVLIIPGIDLKPMFFVKTYRFIIFGLSFYVHFF